MRTRKHHHRLVTWCWHPRLHTDPLMFWISSIYGIHDILFDHDYYFSPSTSSYTTCLFSCHNVLQYLSSLYIPPKITVYLFLTVAYIVSLSIYFSRQIISSYCSFQNICIIHLRNHTSATSTKFILACSLAFQDSLLYSKPGWINNSVLVPSFWLSLITIFMCKCGR